MADITTDTGPILGKDEVNQEIERAAIERREMNFAGKTIEFLSLAEKTVDHGMNFRGCRILGNVFLANATINGNVNFTDAVIAGSFFFGRGRIIGNLDMARATINQPMNMVGLNITGSLTLVDTKVKGFISLAKAVILGDVDMEHVQVSDYFHDDLAVRGDIYLKNAQINGFLNLDSGETTASVNLESALVRKSISAQGLNIGGLLIIKNSIFTENDARLGSLPPDKIIR